MSGRDATDEGAKEPHANHPTPPEHSHHLSAGVVTIADRPSPPQARQHHHFEPNLHHLSRATTTTSTFRRNHVKERGSRLLECPGFQLSVCLSVGGALCHSSHRTSADDTIPHISQR